MEESKSATKAIKSYANIRNGAKKQKHLAFKIDRKHHFNVRIVGMIGKVRLNKDIVKAYGKVDLLMLLMRFFLYGGEIYQLTMYSQPLPTSRRGLKDVDCFLVLANEYQSRSRKECDLFC